ncbi:hypothetical protein FVO59_11790 [Microbacterium esteraromaticum]|uniref:Uncharacterized protein n=1 Tax=Microbacterium esteraromaticum TaxID=57043 RepID=A0A7D7WJ98_9MICO|nr:hypothetical protein [Microbacterium esteraromaticum]QMU97810.1 hypothetical protein FVO59_11790 [Microbacterium esteraromaticum]
MLAIIGTLALSAVLGAILRRFDSYTRWEAFGLGFGFLLIAVGVLGVVGLLVALVVATWGTPL